ncbi:anaerobic ribonucleoside-triphosphate reductase activating protein [Alkalimonas sp. MEB108]|uniref:Anaerobic ribonucleoside-triphosphate reductase activating protein n=1 Tax=Alkalimonas cellulosilytica TaxID=3058395 RepID=A0ABU7J733_9GAMM|nr:anaerobic ribonucleoside-triphosphate reductase activating protein [Alkalimonas sp. MEB108]MEE2002338.1 anaerobic ribonucleoside-triphosphate reductase activating protein [Alkalimonas sp. MEB108]
MLRFSIEQVVWQEVPGEVSLAYTITGCTLGCKGCHSTETWDASQGTLLTDEYFEQRLNQYRGLISCVLFLGGEWQSLELERKLKLARRHGLHTCLYTGLDDIEPKLKAELTYLKTGRWLPERGGLDSLTTNQQLVDLRTGQSLNHRFIR